MLKVLKARKRVCAIGVFYSVAFDQGEIFLSLEKPERSRESRERSGDGTISIINASDFSSRELPKIKYVESSRR